MKRSASTNANSQLPAAKRSLRIPRNFVPPGPLMPVFEHAEEGSSQNVAAEVLPPRRGTRATPRRATSSEAAPGFIEAATLDEAPVSDDNEHIDESSADQQVSRTVVGNMCTTSEIYVNENASVNASASASAIDPAARLAEAIERVLANAREPSRPTSDALLKTRLMASKDLPIFSGDP